MSDCSMISRLYISAHTEHMLYIDRLIALSKGEALAGQMYIPMGRILH